MKQFSDLKNFICIENYTNSFKPSINRRYEDGN
jgi:hypothetical protein